MKKMQRWAAFLTGGLLAASALGLQACSRADLVAAPDPEEKGLTLVVYNSASEEKP